MENQNPQTPTTSPAQQAASSSQPPPSAPAPAQPPVPEPEHSSKRLVMILAGLLLLLSIIGLVAYLILFAQNKSNTSAVIPTPLPTRSVLPTPTSIPSDEEVIDAIDTSNPEADLMDIETDLKELQ